MFKPGDLAYLKTTGEKVVIIDSNATPNTVASRYDVRRPVATKDNGLIHSEDTFNDFELETFEEQLKREFADMEKVETYRANLNAPAKQPSTLVN